MKLLESTEKDADQVKCLPVDKLLQINPKTHTSTCSSIICLFCKGFLTGITGTFRYTST